MREHPELGRLRLFTVARSRFAEDSLMSAVDRGVRQAVVLGAGLDTFGLRNPHADKGLRVFEVDRPETQQWKRVCLEKANLQIPNWLSLVSVDFERQPLLDRLKTVGFKDDRPAFFTWLGVVPYLSRQAVLATLSLIARLPDAEVVFDYGEPPEAYPPERRAGYEAMIARAADFGEPWLSFFVPDELVNALSSLGFREFEDLSPRDIAIRYFGEQDPPQNVPGPHIVRVRCTRV
jgi:methyltransferase (TIGR00027 family)